jgi:hypothetical protein
MREKHASHAAQRPLSSILVEQLSAIYCIWVRLKTDKQPIPGVDVLGPTAIHLEAVLGEHLSNDPIAEIQQLRSIDKLCSKPLLSLGLVGKPLELSYDVKRVTENRSMSNRFVN